MNEFIVYLLVWFAVCITLVYLAVSSTSEMDSEDVLLTCAVSTLWPVLVAWIVLIGITFLVMRGIGAAVHKFIN